MSLSKLRLEQKAKSFNIDGLGEIMIRDMTIGDGVKIQKWVSENVDDDDNVPHDRFMVMKCLCCMVTEDGNIIDIEDANGEPITDDNQKIDAIIGLLPTNTVIELFKACNEVNKPPEPVKEKKSKS